MIERKRGVLDTSKLSVVEVDGEGYVEQSSPTKLIGPAGKLLNRKEPWELLWFEKANQEHVRNQLADGYDPVLDDNARRLGLLFNTGT